MKPLKFTLIGLVAMLAIAIGYGCGGSDDSTGGEAATDTDTATATNDGGAPLSKAAYIKQGDAICTKVPQRYEEEATKLGEQAQKQGKPEPPTAEVNLKAAVPPLYVAIEEFEGLSPPSGEEGQAEAMIDALEAAAKGVEAKPTSELVGPKSPFAEFQKLTKEYGFQFCSQL